MLQTLKNAWKTPDIRKKLLFVGFILLLYRLGTVIPVPFVNAEAFDAQFGNTILAYMDTLSGGALSTATLFALGISPYITASIVIQLLTVAIPKLQAWSQEGEEGKKKLNNLTRYITIILAIATAIGYYLLLKNGGMIDLPNLNPEKTFDEKLGALVIIASFCAGAALVMWLAEKINENGLGNGISLILFANIVSAIPAFVIDLWSIVRAPTTLAGSGQIWVRYFVVALLFAIIILFVVLAMTVFSIFITGSERRIPVQYAKRVVGRKMYGGQNTNLPIKLNMSGVMPVIFASSIISLPATIMTLCGVDGTANTAKGEVLTFWDKAYNLFSPNGWLYPLIFLVLIIAFGYFYTAISFNPVEVANNLKKNGGMIPGIRQGRPTSDYIAKILSRITLIGAIFLGIIAVVPIVADSLLIQRVIGYILTGQFVVVPGLTQYYGLNFTFGGTSLLIVIGVVLETIRELEAQLTMRNYKGFL